MIMYANYLALASLCLLSPIFSTSGIILANARALSDSPGPAVTEPNSCVVCLKYHSGYVPHTRVTWLESGRICASKTFTKEEHWSGCASEEGSRAQAVLPSGYEIPRCEVCHANSSAVDAWHKMWKSDEGALCASAYFVMKNTV